MSKKSKSNKKVVVTTKKEKLKPTVSARSGNAKSAMTTSIDPSQLIFNKGHYTFILASIGLIVLGMILMLGGDMPDPGTWDESLIYSTTRTVIAPIVILAGIGVGVYAIFKR